MKRKPNIVYILADDLGYGDVSCLNPEGKIPTPNLDRLAAQGMRFTDAHSSSAICSPSRYSILTGRYNWRSALQSGIVWQYGDPLIAEDRLTVAGLLKQQGYSTCCLGKWHLGQGWDFEVTEDFLPKFEKRPYPEVATDEQKAHWREGFAKPTTGGPTTRGFDSYFGVDVPNWPPYCFIENDRTIGLPSEFLPKRALEKYAGTCPGPALPDWNFEQILPTLAERAGEYIAEQTARDNPFFLYMPLTSPHTPLAANDEWKGKSALNHIYADFVMETDDIVGRVLDAIEKNGIADDTIVMFASDNGCERFIGVGELEAAGHFPSAHFRGYKTDIWDGGHRIPFIARWPGAIEANTVCDQTVCLSDLMATCADISGCHLPDNAGEDSFSILPLLRGEDLSIRSHVVHHSANGKFAVRSGKWKLVLCAGAGSWSSDNLSVKGGLPTIQLYDMEADPGEKRNLQGERRDVVERLVKTLEHIVEEGRSTPGSPQSNDVPVDIWKGASLTPECDA